MFLKNSMNRLNPASFQRCWKLRKSFSTQYNNSNKAGKYVMLIIPMSGFALGTWQMKRKQWKLNLIKELERKTHSEPIDFPADLSELENLEYRPLKVVGSFDHSREIFVEPRSLIDPDNKKSIDSGSLMSVKSKNVGLHVITPFHIKDRDLTILINRGFVPRDKKYPHLRTEGQIQGETEITGLLRHNEKRPPLSPKNNPSRNHWLYKDLDQMSAIVNTSPILLDARAESTVEEGPIGGQTRVTLRDEHLQYMITWYSLSLITGIMWYQRFFR